MSNPQSAQHSILLIDDHSMFSESLRTMIFKRLPQICRIDLAHDGATARHKLNLNIYNLVLLDIRLGGTTREHHSAGLQLCSFVRKQYPEYKILILSACNESYFIRQARLLGAHGYLLKDMPVSTLVIGIRRVLNGGSYFDQARTDLTEQREIEEQISYLHPRVIEMLLIFFEERGPHNQELARIMGLREKTVRNYMSQAYDQLDLHNRSKLLLWLQEHEMFLRKALAK